MTQIPSNPGNAFGQMSSASMLFPTEREEIRIYEKTLPSGRVVEFVFHLLTLVVNGVRFQTTKLIRGPALDCSCSPKGVHDVLECNNCHALVCSRRHSATCQRCGVVFGTCCVEAILVDDVPFIACKPCSEKLSAGLLKSTITKLGTFLWG